MESRCDDHSRCTHAHAQTSTRTPARTRTRACAHPHRQTQTGARTRMRDAPQDSALICKYFPSNYLPIYSSIYSSISHRYRYMYVRGSAVLGRIYYPKTEPHQSGRGRRLRRPRTIEERAHVAEDRRAVVQQHLDKTRVPKAAFPKRSDVPTSWRLQCRVCALLCMCVCACV